MGPNNPKIWDACLISTLLRGHQDNGQQMGPSHTSCVMYQTPTVIKFPAKHGYLLPSPIVGSRKKSRRSTGLERPTSKTKIYVLLFFDGISYFKLSKTSMNLHEFFKTPVGWSLLTTTYRPQGDQGDQGTHLACSTVSP